VRKPTALGVVSLLIGTTAITLSGSQNRADHDRLHERFVGGWRLASLEAEGPDGKIHRADSTGLLDFTTDGHMSVQVMERNPLAPAPAGAGQYSLGGYEASFGTYAVDENTRTFTFHVDGALVRTLIGKDLPRIRTFWQTAHREVNALG
jgi:hypothetical protein